MATEPLDKSTPSDRIAQAILGLLTIVVIVHTIRTRTVQQIWGASLILAVVLLGLAIVTYGVLWAALRRKPSVNVMLVSLLILPFGALVMGFLYYSTFVSLRDFFLWVRDPSTVSWRAAAASLLVVLTGASLFYFRLRLRSIYGATEVLVGMGIAMQRVFSTPKGAVPLSTDVFLALLTASVYLAVRGFDNIHQGLFKDPFDPLATAFIKWLGGQAATSAPAASEVPTASQTAVPEAGVE